VEYRPPVFITVIVPAGIVEQLTRMPSKVGILFVMDDTVIASIDEEIKYQ
jgi:hypothetical protein